MSAADRERILLLECRLEQLRSALDEAREEADRARERLAEAAAREVEHARRFSFMHEELADARAEVLELHRRLDHTNALRAELEGRLFESGPPTDMEELVRLRREVVHERQRASADERNLERLRSRVVELVASRETVLSRVTEWQKMVREDDPEAADLAEFIAELRGEILELERRNVLSETREAALRERLALFGIDPDADPQAMIEAAADLAEARAAAVRLAQWTERAGERPVSAEPVTTVDLPRAAAAEAPDAPVDSAGPSTVTLPTDSAGPSAVATASNRPGDAGPMELREPAGRAVPLDSSQPTDPAVPLDSSQPTDPAVPLDSSEQMDLVAPMDSAELADSPELIDSAEPADLAEPLGLADRTDPTGPAELDGLADVAEPVEAARDAANGATSPKPRTGFDKVAKAPRTPTQSAFKEAAKSLRTPEPDTHATEAPRKADRKRRGAELRAGETAPDAPLAGAAPEPPAEAAPAAVAPEPSPPPRPVRSHPAAAQILAASGAVKRSEVLLRIGRSGDTGAMDAIGDWTDAPEAAVRASAYEALGRLLERAPDALQPFLDSGLADPDPRVRRRVVLAAATARGLALRPLLGRLVEDPDPQVRRLVREVLRQAPAQAEKASPVEASRRADDEAGTDGDPLRFRATTGSAP